MPEIDDAYRYAITAEAAKSKRAQADLLFISSVLLKDAWMAAFLDDREGWAAHWGEEPLGEHSQW